MSYPHISEEDDPVFRSSPAAKLSNSDINNVKALPNVISNVSKALAQHPKRVEPIHGRDGYTPIKGKDYFTQKEIASIIEAIHSMIPVPKNGYSPVRGVDYFTDSDISAMIDEVLANIRQPEDGKSPVIDYDYVIQKVYELIPKPKDGKDGIGIKGDRGNDGKDGKDAEISKEMLEKPAKESVKKHEKKFDHKLLHDSKLLGTKEIDESDIGKGKFVQYDGKKLVYKPIEFGKGKKSVFQNPWGGLLPNQTGNSGKYLTTDGSEAEWGTVTSYTDALARAAISETITGIDYSSTTGVFSLTTGYVIPTTTEQSNWDTAFGWGNHASAGYLTSVTAHNLLSATHGDTKAESVVRGDLITGQGVSPLWTRLVLGTVGKILRSDGTDLVYSTTTYPDTITANQVLYSTGTNAIGSGTVLLFDGTTLTTGAQTVNGTISPNLASTAAAYYDSRTLTFTQGGKVMYSFPTLSSSYTGTTHGAVFGLEIGFQDQRTLIGSGPFAAGETGSFGIRMGVNRNGFFTGTLTSYVLNGFFSNFVDSGIYNEPATTITKNATWTYKMAGNQGNVSPVINLGNAARTATYNFSANDINVAFAPNVSNCTFTMNAYGQKIVLMGSTAGTSTAYGMYIDISGFDTNWGFYNNSAAAHNLLGKDNVVSYVGTGADSGYYYDNTNTIWKNYVGTGYFDLQMNLQLSAVNIQTDTTTGMKIGTGTTQKVAFFNSTPIVQPANTVAIDTALINLGLWATGASYTPIDKALLANDKIMFTQTDGNEYIDSLADGYIDIDATTGIRLKQDTTLDSNKNLYLSGDAAKVDAPFYYTSGTAPVANGTYNFDGTTGGTVSSISVQGGIIISITTR